jgi:hypothetical protein
MDKIVENPMRRSGWDEQRSIDIAQFVATLVAHGFDVNEHAREFLRRFGGMVVPFVRSDGEEDQFVTTLVYADNVNHFTPDAIDIHMGESSCYCGRCRYSPIRLYIGESGRCTVTEETIWYDLDSIDDALELIFMG